MSAWRRTLLLVAIVAVAAARGVAQETSGTIAGFVTDGGGGLPGVTVRATHVSTGYAGQAVTSARGYYVLTLLPPGRYDVTFALGGDAPSAVRGVDLHVSDRLTVNAVAGATPVDRHWRSGERAVQPGPAIQQVVTARQVEALPLIDRTFTPLAALPIAGVPPPGAGFFLDGAAILDTASAGLLLAPSLESIEEVRIIAGLPGAEWPRDVVVSLVTKSGTNALRGSVYEHHRNDALDANSFLRNSSLDPTLRAGPPRLRQDIFGYTAGGPIRKDALFFFLSQEWRRRRGELPVDAIDARQDTARVDHLSSRLRVLGRYTHDVVEAGGHATGHVLALQAGAAISDTTRNEMSYRMTEGGPGTTHALADDLSFQRGAHTLEVGALVVHEATRNRQEFYAQDWWRLRRGATVDLGLRYAERSLGPRLGVSWVPREGATVVRGGFAVHHAPRPIRQWTLGLARTLYDRGTIDVAYAGSREDTDPARTRYHGLRATLRHEGPKGLADISYALTRYRPLADRTHVFTASWVRDLGRWRISGITTFQSGPPAVVRVGDGPPAGQVSDPFQNLPSDRYYFSPAAFAPFTVGAPPSPLRLPGRNQWDIAASREIPLRSRARLRLWADVFNLFNHTQFSDVDTRCIAGPGDTTCAVPNTTLGQYTAARPPREVQLGLRLSWN